MAELIEQLLQAAALLPPHTREAAASIAIQVILCVVAVPFTYALNRHLRTQGSVTPLLGLVLMIPGLMAVLWVMVVIPLMAVAVRRSVESAL